MDCSSVNLGGFGVGVVLLVVVVAVVAVVLAGKCEPDAAVVAVFGVVAWVLVDRDTGSL